MFEAVKKSCLAGIDRCNVNLSKWDLKGNRIVSSPASVVTAAEVDPVVVVKQYQKLKTQMWDEGADPSADWDLVLFYANAKKEYINRMQRVLDLEESNGNK